MGTATQNFTYQEDQGKPFTTIFTIDLFREQIHAQNF